MRWWQWCFCLVGSMLVGAAFAVLLLIALLEPINA